MRVRVPATSANLGPGFDALGMALDMGLETHVQLADQDGFDGRLEAEGLGLPNNLFFAAAQALYDHIGGQRPKLRVECASEIPRARGLGSSAAAICAGLLAADGLAGSRLSKDKLLALATQIEGHPDNVAPALLGGVTVAVTGRSGVAAWQVPLARNLADRLALVVAIPWFKLSTAKARAALPAAVSHQDAVFTAGRAALLVAALASGDLTALGDALEDRLHEPYRRPLISDLAEVVSAVRAAGAIGVTISGSGPSLLTWCPREAEDGIRDAILRTWGPRTTARSVSISPVGARIV